MLHESVFVSFTRWISLVRIAYLEHSLTLKKILFLLFALQLSLLLLKVYAVLLSLLLRRSRLGFALIS